MEHLTVSLETAKKLEAVGFPQEAIFYISNTGYGYNPHGGHVPDGTIAIPTVQEIADQLRPFMGYPDGGVDPLTIQTTSYRDSHEWFAGYGEQSFANRSYKTMAEALAALFIKLNSPEKE